MKRIFRSLLFLIVVQMIALVPAFSQDDAEPAKIAVFEVKVKPSYAETYDKTVKHHFGLLKKQNFEFPLYAYAFTDFTYHFISPMSQMGSFDTFGKAWEEMYGNLSEEDGKLIGAGYENATEYIKMMTFVSDPEVSYEPEEKADGENNFYFMVEFYVKNGKSGEFRKILKEWADLYESKGVSTAFNIYWGEIGTENPMCFAVFTGESPAAFFQATYERNDILGEERKEVWSRTLSLLREYDSRMGWFREDLSYTKE